LIWILPFIAPSWIVALNFINGVPIYVLFNAIFSTVIQFSMGASFYQSALKSIKNYSANMDVLVVLGTTAAWGYGIALIVAGYPLDLRNSLSEHQYRMLIQNHAHNFEISSALITIILIGKYIETLSKKKTVDKLA
jgi:P-type Cu+ transporter